MTVAGTLKTGQENFASLMDFSVRTVSRKPIVDMYILAATSLLEIWLAYRNRFSGLTNCAGLLVGVEWSLHTRPSC